MKIYKSFALALMASAILVLAESVHDIQTLDGAQVNRLESIIASQIAGATNAAVGGLGSMAYQNSNAVIIVGGSIVFPSSFDSVSRQLIDSSSDKAADWEVRELYDGNLVKRLEWGNTLGALFDPAGVTSANWVSRSLLSSDGTDAVIWENRELKNTGGDVTLNWLNGTLNDGIIVNLDWLNKTAIGSSGVTINWENQTLFLDGITAKVKWGSTLGVLNDDSGNATVDWLNFQLKNDLVNRLDWSVGSGLLFDSAGTESVDFENYELVNGLGGSRITWGAGLGALNDGALALSVDFQNRILHDSTGTVPSVSWETRVLTDDTSVSAMVWTSGVRMLQDFTGADSVGFGDRLLWTSAGSQVLDWENFALRNGATVRMDWSPTVGLLNDSGELVSVDFENKQLRNAATVRMDWSGSTGVLNDSGEVVSINFETRELFDAGGIAPAINYATRNLFDAAGQVAGNWDTRNVLDAAGTQSLNWELRVLTDAGGADAADWDNRHLKDVAGNNTVAWEDRFLDGNWGVTNGNFRIATIGKGLEIAEGADARMGVAQFSGTGTVTVTNSTITAVTRVSLTHQGSGTGTPGNVWVETRTVGADFEIRSSNGTDDGQVLWILIEP